MCWELPLTLTKGIHCASLCTTPTPPHTPPSPAPHSIEPKTLKKTKMQLLLASHPASGR